MRFIRGHNSVGVDRSGPRIKERWKEEDRGYVTPCWIWLLKTNKTGYGYTGTASGTLAHRFHYEEAKGPIPTGMQLDHLCRVRLCVNPDHLEPVTPLENTRRSRSMVLTADQAGTIYQRRRAGETIRALAAEFGVSKETVRLIGLNGTESPRRG